MQVVRRQVPPDRQLRLAHDDHSLRSADVLPVAIQVVFAYTVSGVDNVGVAAVVVPTRVL
jgi:hypothetical protein